MTIHERVREIVAASPNPVIIEIGAADGEDTEKLSLAIAATGRTGRLIAFECEPKNIPAIHKRAIPGLQLHEMAVGDKTGPASFIGSGSWAYSGSLKEPKLHRISHAWIPFQPPIQVRCITLDDVFQTCSLDHIDFIWMDVQGAEDLVIAGGQQALAKTEWIWAEVYETDEYEGHIGREEFRRRLPGNWEITEIHGTDILFHQIFP